ncbi:MAG TPA: GNAT family N-acetyltransferase [Actinomycetota bacterium]|nr:GNAT family N-acetyltransferase [Actinomycetota bacterium]
MIVRPAAADDLERINNIYNHYVLHSQATFDVEPITIERRREWFSHYSTSGPHRLLVADDGGVVLGFATSSPFRTRAAYATSIETSVYCNPDRLGAGIGAKLYARLFEDIKGEDLHRAYAGISLPNDASVSLHERFGFVKVGEYTEVGRKFGRYWNVAWFEKVLG